MKRIIIIIDGFIPLCVNSSSFAKAAANFEYLVELAPFSVDQMKSIFEGTIRNRQVYDSFGAQRVLDRLMREQAAVIPCYVSKCYDVK